MAASLHRCRTRASRFRTRRIRAFAQADIWSHGLRSFSPCGRRWRGRKSAPDEGSVSAESKSVLFTCETHPSPGSHRRCDPTSPARGEVNRLAAPYSRDAIRPSLAKATSPRRQRARGKPGADCTRSLACKMEKHTSGSHYRFDRAGPGLPRASGFTVSFVLSPVSVTFESPSSARCKASSPT
jgi:hypothetical protein